MGSFRIVLKVAPDGCHGLCLNVPVYTLNYSYRSEVEISILLTYIEEIRLPSLKKRKCEYTWTHKCMFQNFSLCKLCTILQVPNEQKFSFSLPVYPTRLTNTTWWRAWPSNTCILQYQIQWLIWQIFLRFSKSFVIVLLNQSYVKSYVTCVMGKGWRVCNTKIGRNPLEKFGIALYNNQTLPQQLEKETQFTLSWESSTKFMSIFCFQLAASSSLHESSSIRHVYCRLRWIHGLGQNRAFKHISERKVQSLVSCKTLN